MAYRFLSILFTLCIACQNVDAQHEYVFDSIYQPLPSYSGWATFNYHLGDKGEYLKSGDFVFESKRIDSSRGMVVEKRSWNGTYDNNKKVGDWKYVTLKSKLNVLDITNTFEVEYSLLTEKEVLKAQYQNGKPNGKWRLENEILKDGKPSGTAHSIAGILNEAKFNGNLEMNGLDENKQAFSFEGETAKGLMDGEWYFRYYQDDQEIEEIRYYEKGFLLRLFKTDVQNDERILELDFPISPPLAAYLNGEKQVAGADRPMSLLYNDGYPRTSPLVKEQQMANSILERAIDQLFKYELNYLETFGLPLGTNRIIYPLESDEKELIKKWARVEFQFRDKLNAIDSMVNANFNSAANDTLNMIDEWVGKQLFLQAYIKPWNQIIAHEEIIYYNREGPLYDYAVDLLKEDTLTNKETVTILNYDGKVGSDSNFLAYIIKNFEQRILVADSLFKVYDRIAEQLKLQAEIRLQELQISQLKYYLDSVYAQGEQYGKDIQQLFEQLKHRFLTTYFNEKKADFMRFKGSKEVQQLKGDSLIRNLRLLKDIHFVLEDIFYTAANIDTLYTEYVFDAYTFNDRFPKRIKKKLYQAIAVELYKDLLQQAKFEITPLQVRETLNHIQALQERMLFLADKNTAKLERKLKEKMTMEEKFELMKIE